MLYERKRKIFFFIFIYLVRISMYVKKEPENRDPLHHKLA